MTNLHATPDDTEFPPEDEANVPHEFIECRSAHLFEAGLDPIHCAICHRTFSHEIHKGLPLFDTRPATPVQPSAHVESGIRRLIEAKAGTFRELLEGGAVGREFRIAEMQDGTILRLFTDGTRGPSPVAVTSFLIEDAIRAGVYVEVEA